MPSVTVYQRTIALLLLLLLLPTAWGQQQDESWHATFRNATEAMRAGQWDEAAAGFSSVIKASPSFAEAYFNLGLVRLQQGNLDDGVTNLTHALTLSPKLRGANLFLGIAQYRENHYGDAIAALKRE